MWQGFLIAVGEALLPFIPRLGEALLARAAPKRVAPVADRFDEIDAATRAKIAETAAREAAAPELKPPT